MNQKTWITLVGAAVLAGTLLLIGLQPFHSSPPGPPPSGTEEIIMTSYQLQSSTNVTLTLINSGTDGSTTLVSYTAKDSSGSYYTDSSWGVNIAQGSTVTVNVLTNGSVSFQKGNTYTITVATSKSHQFVFTLHL